MYKEEELKRLHAAGYGQVGFNYDTPSEPAQVSQPTEVDEPFLPTPSFQALLPVDVVLPDSLKQNAIIEKTANFIALQGVQMEILIKTKQGDNPQFQFLNKDSVLHPYYTALIALVKAGKWPEKKVEVIEEKPHEPEEYLHPSLASTVIESAPSIPSIHYKPSADCDYTMLISKMRGEATMDEAYTPELAPGEVAPPGTEPLPPRCNAEISRAPVMYNKVEDVNHRAPSLVAGTPQTPQDQYAAYYQQYMAEYAPSKPKRETTAPLKSTGLSLMKNYDTDSDSDVSDFDDTSSTDSREPPVVQPPEDVHSVIDKMAAYVARNGDEFAEIVRAKNDPRFTFLDPDNVYHPYYKRLMQSKRGVDVNGKGRERKQKKSSVPVSFSIKKLKEPDPILPKPALPYESSSDDDSEQQNDKVEEPKEVPKTIPQIPPVIIPSAVVYKIEATQNNEVQLVAPIEIAKPIPKPEPIIVPEMKEIRKEPTEEEKLVATELENNTPKEIEEIVKEIEPAVEKKEERKEEKYKERERSSPRREKKKHRDKDKDRKKEYHSKSISREEVKDRRVDRRSVDREKKREKEREREREADKEKKRQRVIKEELENEIISLEDNSDDLIDLTGDLSDTKGECETEGERAKQQERRRRAAEFLKKVGVDPAAAALPTTSLASAMVDTLESLRRKKADEEEKRRRREKRRHRDRYGYEDGSDRFHRKSKRRKYKSSDENEESDYDGSKKKKRKKDKKRSTSKSRRKRRSEVEIEVDPPLNIDLTNTLKELRTSSPTKELGLQEVDDVIQHSLRQESSSDDMEEEQEPRRVKNKKQEREYSEGEWSSDSDSGCSPSTKND
ncbi:protein suppressor of white apricot isoform X2 [Achroia grisella]|nr:protein suppressor of white apricot isoform X2 [Achroia grisella]